MLTTMVPARFTQEPLAVRAYDRWQDAEGMVDAKAATRRAWHKFGKTWAAARDRDLKRETSKGTAWREGLTQADLDALKSVVSVGRTFGLVKDHGRFQSKAVANDVRKAWFAWRSDVIAFDPDAWGSFWSVVSGEDPDTLAEARGIQPQRVIAEIATFARLWVTHFDTCGTDEPLGDYAAKGCIRQLELC